MFSIKKIKQLNYLNISQYHVWQKIQDVGRQKRKYSVVKFKAL